MVSHSQTPTSGKVTTNYTYRHFAIKDGIPQIQITTLFCDSKGFVWIGTKFGFARWDGKTMHSFTILKGASGKLVSRFYELGNGNIIVTYNGGKMDMIVGNTIKSIYIPAKYNIHHFAGVCVKGNNFTIFINQFTADYNNKKSLLLNYNYGKQIFDSACWINTSGVLDVDTLGYAFVGADLLKGILPGKVLLYKNETCIDSSLLPKNCVYSNSSNNKLHFVAKENKELILYTPHHVNNKIEWQKQNTGIIDSINYFEYTHLVEIEKDAWLYANSDEQLIVKTKTSKTILALVPTATKRIIDKEGNLWVGSENGLFCFFKQGFTQTTFHATTDEVWSMAKSKGGVYYYASYNKGFWQSADRNTTWQKLNFFYDGKEKFAMHLGSFGSKALKNGQVILAAHEGIHLVNNGSIKSINLGFGGEVFSTWEDTILNCLYISKYQILFKVDLLTYKIDTVLKMPLMGVQTIMNVVANRQGQLIASGRGGSVILINGKWQLLQQTKGHKATASFIDFKNNLWYNNDSKLCFLKNGKVTILNNLPIHQLILSLTQYKKWLIIGGGVELLFLDLEEFYNSNKELYYRFDAGNGFTVNEGGQNSFMHDDDGSIWWPCMDKIIRFWPDKLLGNSSVIINSPLIELVKATSSKAEQLILSDTTNTATLYLAKQYRKLQFNFTAAVMANNQLLKFRFRLKEKDTSWSNLQDEGIAIFENLEPGKYSFEVQATTDGENWGRVTAFKTIEIEAYWYETFLAKISFIFFGIIGIVGITLYFTKRRRKQLQRQKLINELQLKSIRSKSIPHFSGNAFANIDYLIESGDKRNASRYIALLSRLHNATLSNAEKPACTLYEELEYVKMYLELEVLRFEEKLSYKIIVHDNVNQEILIPNMCIHCFAENAVKHGLQPKQGKGELTITCLNTAIGINIQVQDNGIGLVQSKLLQTQGHGVGLSLLRKQIELYNKTNKEKIVFQIVDLGTTSSDEKGVLCTLLVPKDYHYT